MPEDVKKFVQLRIGKKCYGIIETQNEEDAYDYCPCGNPKWKISKKCHVCAKKKEDGSFAKKT